MFYTVKGYFHPVGTRQTPDHSEYEVNMSGIHKIMVVKNGELIDDHFVQVIDEKKPVYLVISSIGEEQIWKFTSHLSERKQNPGAFNAESFLTSDIGAVLVQKIGPHCDGYIKIRIGDEAYYAGDVHGVWSNMNRISYEDLLAFVAEEIPWSGLKGRSYLYGKKKEKELSSQRKNAEFARELKKVERVMQNFEKGLVSSGEELISIKEKLISANEELTSTKEDLGRIPKFIKKAYSINVG